MTLPMNLDVTALFPYPSERAVRPSEEVQAPISADAVGATRSTEAKVEKTTEPSAAELGDSLQQLNAGLKSFGIEFELSEVDHRLVTRVVDRTTGELIRQIPSEEVLRMARAMEQTSGLLLQATA